MLLCFSLSFALEHRRRDVDKSNCCFVFMMYSIWYFVFIYVQVFSVTLSLMQFQYIFMHLHSSSFLWFTWMFFCRLYSMHVHYVASSLECGNISTWKVYTATRPPIPYGIISCYTFIFYNILLIISFRCAIKRQASGQLTGTQLFERSCKCWEREVRGDEFFRRFVSPIFLHENVIASEEKSPCCRWSNSSDSDIERYWAHVTYEVGAKRSEQRVCIGMEYDSKRGKPKGNGKPKAALSSSFLICIYK